MEKYTTIIDDLDEIIEAIKGVLPVDRVYLYGSYAYGEPDEHSDIDLYVLISDDCGINDVEAAARAYGARRKAATSIPVDILASKSYDFHSKKNKFRLQQDVYNKGVCIYAKDAQARRQRGV
jgi:predicted nucleotidyltransferase